MRPAHASRAAGLLAALGLAACLLALLTPQAVAAPVGGSGSTSTSVSFGPLLNWGKDTAAGYARRLDGTPQLYAKTIGYPIGRAQRSEIANVAYSAAAQKASILLQLDPTEPLSSLTSADARTLASALDSAAKIVHVQFVVDFAPEMNGSWVAWGQQPRAYVAAFRTLATALHAQAADSAQTLWEPANGAGYPFGGVRGDVHPSGPRVTAQLDTNGDGRVTDADDPYGPYWPGSSYVDRVGLSLFWYGRPGHLGTDAVPPANWFRNSLLGRVGYATRTGTGRDFVARFATAQRPLTVETAALALAGSSSAATTAADAVRENWIRQVLNPQTLAAFPIDTVVWFEQQRAEDEAGGRTVDWRATTSTVTLAALQTALRRADILLGPAPSAGGRTEANSSLAQADGQGAAAPAASSSGVGGRWLLGGVVVLTGMMLAAGLATRLARRWRYPVAADPDRGAASARDGRVDLFRGFVMCAVVVTHIGLAGPFSWFVARMGAVLSAEMFVLLSGIVLGAGYPLIVLRQGAYAASLQMLRRAFTLYLKTLAAILAVFFLVKLPFVDGNSVTTFTDRGTGGGGAAAAGRVYYLYGTAQHLLDYPVPAYALRDLFLLRYGPWPMNIMGLFVVLSAAVPACMWLVQRRLWWVLLGASWGLYLLNAVHHVTLFDGQFEAVFPLLTWQIAFTHGLVIGRYRRQIASALRSHVGLAAIGVLFSGYIAVLLMLRAGVHIPGVPTWATIFQDWYDRTYLEGGRLLNLVVCGIAVYAFLTALWRPAHATIGRVFEPLGRGSLTAFLLQVFAVLAAGNIHSLNPTSAWQGALVQVVAIAIIWVLVQHARWRRMWAKRRARRAVPATATPGDTRAPELVGAGR